MIEITKHTAEKRLTKILPKQSGRNNTGQITARHRGGRQKRYYREIDFKRNKHGVPGRIVAFEYDPNRNVTICLVHYQDGEKRYILSPLGLKIGDQIVSGVSVETHAGNALALKNIPIGTPVHNVELHPGRGGQLVRGAGTAAYVLSCEGGFVHLKLPSSEVRMVDDSCFATVGQLANIERKTQILG